MSTKGQLANNAVWKYVRSLDSYFLSTQKSSDTSEADLDFNFNITYMNIWNGRHKLLREQDFNFPWIPLELDIGMKATMME